METSRYGLKCHHTLDPAAAYLGMWQRISSVLMIFDDAEYEDLMAKAALKRMLRNVMQLLHDARRSIE